MSRVVACWRIALHASNPFMRGITTSIRIRSGCSCFAFSTASCPSDAVTHRYDARFSRISRSISNAVLESSTTSTFLAIVLPRLRNVLARHSTGLGEPQILPNRPHTSAPAPTYTNTRQKSSPAPYLRQERIVLSEPLLFRLSLLYRHHVGPRSRPASIRT